MADVDIDLIVKELRNNGHTVEGVHRVPSNAGDYEMIIDGESYSLEETRQILERDQSKK
jgi:hypothetical protein